MICIRNILLFVFLTTETIIHAYRLFVNRMSLVVIFWMLVERGKGIEPSTLAWKAKVIPFYEPRNIGGSGEIRTHGPLSGPLVFKTNAIGRSATLP